MSKLYVDVKIRVKSDMFGSILYRRDAVQIFNDFIDSVAETNCEAWESLMTVACGKETSLKHGCRIRGRSAIYCDLKTLALIVINSENGFYGRKSLLVTGHSWTALQEALDILKNLSQVHLLRFYQKIRKVSTIMLLPKAPTAPL